MKQVTIAFSGCIIMSVDAATDAEAEKIAMDKLLASKSRFDPPQHDVLNIGAMEVRDAEVVDVK